MKEGEHRRQKAATCGVPRTPVDERARRISREKGERRAGLGMPARARRQGSRGHHGGAEKHRPRVASDVAPFAFMCRSLVGARGGGGLRRAAADGAENRATKKRFVAHEKE